MPDHSENLLLDSKAFEYWLGGMFFEGFGDLEALNKAGFALQM